jgi:hypothetical protein
VWVLASNVRDVQVPTQGLDKEGQLTLQ